MIPSPNPTAPIREYYEQNTRLFERLGSSNKTRSIHRALWPPGVKRLDEALEQSNRLVLQSIRELDQPPAGRALLFADLGCGLGGTLAYLLQYLPPEARGLGLTLSPTQARIGLGHLRRSCPAARAAILEGDFLSLPLRPGFDALLSIEAFCHAPDPRRYLDEAARILRPGGRLVLVDDFLPDAAPPAHPQQARWLAAYRRGWVVPGLSPLPAVIAWAADAGLQLHSQQDLTPWLRFRILPAPLTAAILRLGFSLPLRHAILPSILGSLALQHCLQAGLVTYRLLVFARKADR